MWIVFGIAAILFFCNTLREIHVYRDIKSTFICNNCSTLNEKISGIHKCIKCHRGFEIKNKQWEHLLLHRVTWMETKNKAEDLILKEYIKVPKIEIVLSSLATLILLIGTILGFNMGW